MKQKPEKPENPYAEVWAAFKENVLTPDENGESHRLKVIKDDGLYRHLRMKHPRTGMYGWEVMTWPGYLSVTGDVADGYTFTRIADMLQFFTRPKRSQNYYSDGSPSIDFRYWAQKLSGGRAYEVKTFSSKKFKKHVEEIFRERLEDAAPSAEEVAEAKEWGDELSPHPDPKLVAKIEELRQSMRRVEDYEHAAYEWMQENDDFFGSDWYEYDFTEYEFHFILACYCLDETTRRYWAYKTPQKERRRKHLRRTRNRLPRI